MYKMKKGLYAILAALAVFALALTGCPTTDDNTGDQTQQQQPPPPSNETRLRQIKIGSGEAKSWGEAHDNKATQDAVTVFIEVNVSSADKANASVTLTSRTNPYPGTIKIGVLGDGTNGPAAVVYQDYDKDNPPSFQLDDGYKIYVEMTAPDGTKAYYGATILSGRDNTIKEIIFRKTANDTTRYRVEDFGKPAATLDEITGDDIGFILIPILQPTTGFSVEASPNDSAASVAFKNSTEADTAFSGTKRLIKFNQDDGELLIVKVTAEKGQIAYYKISVEYMEPMIIPYGVPSLYSDTITDADANKAYVDPLWDAIEWIPVARQNRAETTASFFADPSTKGRAKLYWDTEGLWLYVDVETKFISTNENFEHEGSSVELFINEAYPTVNAGGFDSIGGQYRVDSNGALSGDPTAAVNALRSLDRYKAFKTKNTDGTDKGYAVMFQAPWRFTVTYPPADQKDISLEIQINAAAETSVGRVGVLKWYNTVANTYQNAGALAQGTLNLGDNILPAMKPSFTTQPLSKKVPQNATMPQLKVVAESPDGGELSYQWYKATSLTNKGGTVIGGATDATYTPTESTATVAEFFYYVAVTNTLPAVGGGTAPAPTTANSAVAQIRIIDITVTAQDIEFVVAGVDGWDATTGTLIITPTAGAAVATLPFPATGIFDAEKYSGIVFEYTAYKDDVIITNFGNRYNLDFCIRLHDDTGSVENWGYNASAIELSGDGVISNWNFTGATAALKFTEGSYSILIWPENKTNSGANAATKLVVKSLKLISKD
jgi:hypothetical protein